MTPNEETSRKQAYNLLVRCKGAVDRLCYEFKDDRQIHYYFGGLSDDIDAYLASFESRNQSPTPPKQEAGKEKRSSAPDGQQASGSDAAATKLNEVVAVKIAEYESIEKSYSQMGFKPKYIKMTLRHRCVELLNEIEKLGPSEEATNLTVMCGDLLTAIEHGNEERGEYDAEERKLLNMSPVANSSTKPTRQSQTVLDAWERALFYLEDKNYEAVRKIILDALTLLDEPTTKPATSGENWLDIFYKAVDQRPICNAPSFQRDGLEAVAAEASRRAVEEERKRIAFLRNQNVELLAMMEAGDEEISALRGSIKEFRGLINKLENSLVEIDIKLIDKGFSDPIERNTRFIIHEGIVAIRKALVESGELGAAAQIQGNRIALEEKKHAK